MKRSKVSLSNYKLLSCDMGELIPIGLTEVLPGDTIQHSTNLLVRAAPLLAPVMHPVYVTVRHFFVPNRIVFPKWEEFITGGPDGMDATVLPNVALNPTNTAQGTLADYFGFPTLGAGTVYVNALPFRMYNLIYNEFYRDQDLQAELPVPTGDGGVADPATNYSLQRPNWEKDYYTTARPWEQKGPTVNVPVNRSGQAVQMRMLVADPNSNRQLQGGAAANPAVSLSGGATSAGNIAFGDVTGLQVNINLLREAFAMQRFEEARARYGSRYVEYLRYLGVRSSDARLQRPEYLGGGRQTIQFSEVLQTAEGTDPVGDLKGHGIAAMRSNRYRRFFEEHGYVMSLMYVRPKTMYTQGIPRHFLRRTRDEYWQKELEHIGQQEIWNSEVYWNAAQRYGTFGFQNRYEEYRRAMNTVAGEFRTSVLNYWHFARNFGSEPALNSAFVTCTPTEVPFAVPSQDVLYIMAYHSMQARRLVSSSTGSWAM